MQTVLVRDDDAALRDTIGLMLEKEGGRAGRRWQDGVQTGANPNALTFMSRVELNGAVPAGVNRLARTLRRRCLCHFSVRRPKPSHGALLLVKPDNSDNGAGIGK